MNDPRPSTGATIAFAAILTVGLSVLPFSDALRPLPEVRERGFWSTLVSLARPAPKPVRGSVVNKNAVTSEEQLAGLNLSIPPSEATDWARSAVALQEDDVQRAKTLEALAVKVGAVHVDIQQKCTSQEPGECDSVGMGPFFNTLTQHLAELRKQPIRIVHLGDSQIASDYICETVRERLQSRYGYGGRGFLFVDRPTRFSGRKTRTGDASNGWKISKITDPQRVRDTLGFSGVTFTATAQSPQKTEFDVGPNRAAEVFFVTQPNGGMVQIKSDGKPLSKILTQASLTEPGFAKLDLPPGARTLSLLTSGGPVMLNGLSLEAGAAGIVYDSVGIPGATAEVFLRADERPFAKQLSRRNPALVVVMLGGNDANQYDKGWITFDTIRKTNDAFLKRIRNAVPNAACLVTSPMDAGFRTAGGGVRLRKGSREISDMLRELAFANGCAYWDMLAAMGGEGAVTRWTGLGLMNEDLIHPRASGADLLGHLLDFALDRAYTKYVAAAAANDPPGLHFPSGLSRTLDKLKALESTKQGRVGVVQLGASHTAAHVFTDEIRLHLARRFGDAGRGFIAAGPHSPRLTKAKVRRSLTGEWTVLDAVGSEQGLPWGLTGIRAEAQVGSTLEISFCEGCSEGTEPGRLELYYMEEPGMGRLSVFVDGTQVDTLPKSAAGSAQAKVVSFPTVGASHRIQVKNEGPGKASLFGAAFEMNKAGVVYDALGLPGSTSMVADGFEKETFISQLKARRADLFVLFYGTNESGIADLDPGDLRKHYVSLLSTLKKASPDAECLMIGPTDRSIQLSDGTWADAPSQMKVIRTLRDVAAKQGCAFWSARAAMGGSKAMLRWRKMSPPLGHADGVHLTPRGYQWIARLFVDDVLGALDASRKTASGRGP